jgi:hypothetical protein
MADVRLTATNPEDSSVVPVACDASGRLLLQDPEVVEGPQGPQGPPGPPGQDGDPFTGNFAGDVTFEGSVQVKTGVGNSSGNCTINPSGQYTTRSMDGDDTALSIGVVGSGELSALYADGSAKFAGKIDANELVAYKKTTTATDNVIRVFSDVGSANDVKVEMKADGSASFAGYGVFGQALFVNAEASVTPAGARSTVSDQGGFSCARATSGNSSSDIVFQSGSVADSDTVLIYSDGSAEFAGGNGVDANQSLGIDRYGRLNIREDASTAADVFDVYKSTVKTVAIRNDGSCSFAGGKAGFTAEGYLWCTTRRGDTVILDATSNGLGSWVEYTPTSRIDEIRDKMDANRRDTGEMPADTP